jgi:hypothetical protein
VTRTLIFDPRTGRMAPAPAGTPTPVRNGRHRAAPEEPEEPGRPGMLGALREWLRPLPVPVAEAAVTPPPPAVPRPPDPTRAPAWIGVRYQQGDRSEHLRRWQRALRERGYDSTESGHFDLAVLALVERLQRDNDLPVTGVIDPCTWAAAWTGTPPT